jgi:hypothetical protein
MPFLGALLFAAISVSPPSASLPPKGSTVFVASGGTAPYTFQLTSSESGGTIAGTTYTAGPRGDTQDLIRVNDANGDTKTVSVSIGPGVTVSPTTKKLPPHGSVTFDATGGSGTGFVWTVDGAGTIDSGGHYVAGQSGGATVTATDSLGNVDTALVTIGPNIAIDPTDVTIAPGNTVAFAATGGSGVYTFALLDGPSSGSIDGQSGLYHAGPTGKVTDVVVVKDDLGNFAEGSVHVSAAAATNPGKSSSGSSGAVGSTTTNEAPVRAHAINLAGGGGADNACDCGFVGSPVETGAGPLLGAVLAVALGLRRRRG